MCVFISFEKLFKSKEEKFYKLRFLLLHRFLFKKEELRSNLTGNNEMPNGVHFRRRISVAKVGIYAKNEACDVYPFPLELLRTMASNVYATSFDPLLAL